MSIIKKEVPGATMKVYVLEEDTADAYSVALSKIVNSDNFYSVSVLTDNESVIGEVLNLSKTAGSEEVSKWKMGIVAPRLPYLNRKMTTDDYTITDNGNDEFTVEFARGGLALSGMRVGDSLFKGSDIEKASDSYYEQYAEPYSSIAVATIEQVVTDQKMIVKTVKTGFDLINEMSGETLIVGIVNKHQNLIDAVKAKAESYGSHSIVMLFPDKYEIIEDNSSIIVPGFIFSAVVNAVMAHLPPQQGLSNLAFNSITRVIGSSFYFSDRELDEIASSGVFVVIQDNYASKPYVLRQLTTDMSALETMEINKVRCLDYASAVFSEGLDDYVGKRNITEANTYDIKKSLAAKGGYLIDETKKPYLGPVITYFNIVQVVIPEDERDAVEAIVEVNTPTSMNKIRLFVKSTIQ